MANIKSIQGNPIVVDTSGIEGGAVTDDKLDQNGVVRRVALVQSNLDKARSDLYDSIKVESGDANNLFNRNGSLKNGFILNDGSIATNGAYAKYATTDYITLDPTSTYQFAILDKSTSENYEGITSRRVVAVFGPNKSVVVNYSNGFDVYTITGASYIRVSVQKEYLSDSSDYGPVVQLGASLQPYEDYDKEIVLKAKIELAQQLGESETLPISQKAVTDEVTGVVKKARMSKNVFNPRASVDGYINDSSGSIVEYQTYKTTDYIDVSGFEHDVCVTGTTRDHLQYDENKRAIPSTYSNVISENPIIPVATGAHYIRLTYYGASYESTFQVEDNTTQTSYEPHTAYVEDGVNFLNDVTESAVEAMIGSTSSDVLYGKKWWACGDSFTEWTTETYAPSDAPNVTGLKYYKTYPYWIGKRTGMTVYNFAKSGQTMAMPANPGTFTNAFANGLYQQIPSDVDYITLKFGINDSHHAPGSSGGDGEDNTGVIPIGDVSDTGTSTFCGAYNTVLAYLIEHHPNAKIGILVSNGCDTDEYRQKAILIAQKWGLPYLDENGSDRCPALIRSSNPNVSSTLKELRKTMWASTSTNTHPNVAAHEFESTIVEVFLRSL